MSKPPKPEDPMNNYSGVHHEQGGVQQDSDWNQGGAGSGQEQGEVQQDADWNQAGQAPQKGGGPARRLLIGGSILVILALAASTAWYFLRRGQGLPFLPVFSASSNTPIGITLLEPSYGAAYTIGAPIPVSAAVVSEQPIQSLELWVDGKLVTATQIGAGPTPGTNLALNAPATASRASLEFSAAMAVDGDLETWWGASDDPPQWIEIDLGAPQSVAGLRLIPSQFPTGATTHRILARTSLGGALIPLHTLSSSTSDNVPLDYTPPAPWEGLRILRIETTASPSWVSWREIQIISGEPLSTPRAEWFWTPETPGEHILQVRAVDSSGRSNYSNMVRITGIEGSSGIPMDVYTAQEGDTLEAVAAQAGIPLASLQMYNSQTPGQPVSQGESIFLPTIPLPIAGEAAGVSSVTPTFPRFENGVLLPGKAVEVAYLYLRYEGSTWQRIPSNPDEFVPVEDGGVHFKSLLPDAFKPFEYEAWGWNGGTLVYIGGGTSPGTVFDLGVMKLLPIDLTQLGVNVPQVNSVTLQWEDRFVDEKTIHWDMTTQYLQLKFQWDTKTGAQQGQWQVLSVPSYSSDMMNPPGLMATGKVGAADEFFTIDFSKIVSPPPGTGGQSQQTTNPPVPPGSSPSNLGAEALSLGNGEVAIQNLILPPIGTYYVRILPVTNNQVVGFPSNNVTVNYGPGPEPLQLAAPAQPLFEARFVDFDPGVFPDPNQWGCVEIIKKDPNYPMVLFDIELLDAYEPGQVICPKPWSGDNAFTVWDVFDFLVEAWNWVSEAFNDLKSFVVNLALSFLPCGPIEDICKGVLDAALNYGLASLGVPPSLPNFDQVVNAGKGHVVDLVVQQALDNFPPAAACFGPCEDELRKTIGQGIDALAEEARNMSVSPACGNEQVAHEHGRKPLCIIGYIVKPAHGSIYEIPVAIVEVKRKPGVELPSWVQASYVCSMKVSLNATNSFPGGWVPGPYGSNTDMQVDPQQISGLLFDSDSIPLLEMPAGATQEIAMALNPANGNLLFPWTKTLWKNSQTPPKKHFGLTNDWFTLYNNASAELTVGGSYFGSDSSCVEAKNNWTEVLP